MTDLTPQVFEMIGTSGVPALLMVLAIRWLVASNKEQQEANRQLVAQLNQERADRLEAMETHIEECKAHIQECDADRHALRAELVRLAQARGHVGHDEEMPRDPPTTHVTPKSKAFHAGR